MYFKTKVKYLKQDEASGKVKKINEEYMVQADSFTEAEANITRMMMLMIDDFQVVGCSGVSMDACIFDPNDSDYWFKAGVETITYDEASEKEKKQVLNYYIQADDLESAINSLKEFQRDSVSDWELVSMSKTKVLEVYDYKTIAEQGAELLSGDEVEQESEEEAAAE
jgi:hypothetical protein